MEIAVKVLDDYDDLRKRGINYSKPHLWRLERDEKFPKRVKLSAGRIAWVAEEIDDWLAQKIAARDANAA